MRLRWLVGLLLCAVAMHALRAQQQPVSVEPSMDEIPRTEAPLNIVPMPFGRKAGFYAKNTFYPAPLLLPVLPAAIVMADPPRHYPREWSRGAAAFGRNYADCLTTEVAANTGKFLVGAMTHEDPRYYPARDARASHRIWHAVVFTVVDRSDRGTPEFAASNFAGALSAGFVGMSYRPRGYDDLVHAGQRTGGALGGFAPSLLVGYATQNLLSEYSPEMKRLGHKLHLPFIPE